MLPAERRDVGDKFVGHCLATGAQFLHGAPEIDGVPEDDGGDGEIEAGRAVTLVFKGSVADFAEPVKEYRSGKGVPRLALVEAGVRPPPQGGVADPVEGEQRALQTANFPDGSGERVLFWIGGEPFHQN